VIAGSTDQERSSVLDTVGAWMDLVHEAYPRSDALAWDRPGLQVGDPLDGVARVLVSLDVTRAVIDEAASVADTLLLAHHPRLLSPLVSLTPATAAGSLALRAARAGVTVAAAHTNLDAADDGSSTSEPVVALLGLRDVGPLCAPARPGARPMGRVGDLLRPLTLAELAIEAFFPADAATTAALQARAAVAGGDTAAARTALDDLRTLQADLERAYETLYQSTRRYILVCEYFSQDPVAIPYRGQPEALWKRDFAGDLLDSYDDLQVVAYGFAWRRDPDPQDDLSYFLLEKRQ
jgi:hypothetical protein